MIFYNNKTSFYLFTILNLFSDDDDGCGCDGRGGGVCDGLRATCVGGLLSKLCEFWIYEPLYNFTRKKYNANNKVIC